MPIQPIGFIAPTAGSVTQPSDGQSMYFDGSGSEQHLLCSLPTPRPTKLSLGTGDFTFEMWAYKTRYETYVRMLSVANKWGFEYGGEQTKWNTPFEHLITTSGPAINTWIHFAVARFNAVTRLYYNGGPQNVGTVDTRNYDISAGAAHILLGGGMSGFPYKGYIDSIRITKGLARYTTGFTPPTTPFTSDSHTVGLWQLNNANWAQDLSSNPLPPLSAQNGAALSEAQALNL
jgi:hypothetical protein